MTRVLHHRVRRALQRLRRDHRATRITIRIVDDAMMRQLQQRHMGEDVTTDVLAFPDGDGPPGTGDIALNWCAVTRQACGPGWPARLTEATVLSVHGLAHLLGHDHRTRRQARAMLRDEQRALRRVGIAEHRRTRPESGSAA